MSLDVAAFRAAYPPFADATQYPDARVTYWLDFAAVMVNSRRWQRSGLQDYGQGLLAAHYLTVMERYDAASGAYSLPSGTGSGAATSQSQSADGVSWSEGYDAGAYAGDGQLASTAYGRQFLDLRALVGAGGMQL